MTDLASNGTPMDVLTEEDWNTPYGLTKFDTVAAEKLHHWSLSQGYDEECGNAVDWHWWAARFDGDPEDPDFAGGSGVILTEMSGGSVTATRYDSVAEYNAAWFNVEDQWLTYVHQDCEAGRECDGCPECENA